MFYPKYTITDRLLANIKRVNALINELNNRRFPHVVLVEFEKLARAVSTYASTSIEGNPLPLTEVKKILKSKPAHINKFDTDVLRDSEREVLNYNQALHDLNKKLEEGRVRLSLDLILKIQKQIIDGLLAKFESGKLRDKPVVVNNPRTRKVIYLPPDAKDVSQLMLDLIEFINNNSDKIDSLILAGIFHKQMVIIHPFMDGNGRTARLATKVLLAEMGLNTFNLFSFENYYNKNVTRYFQFVGEFGNYYELKDSINFTSWLEYFTEGIIDELLRVQKLLPGVGISPETQLEPYHLKILEFIKEKGFIADRDYAKLVNRAKATRALDFRKLTELGLIERKAKGKATYYVLKDVENLLALSQ
ncbi:Fic family protein [Candidatus Curtissbacteria bacterium]|nr:Fic family protein [Candidatus Curtissbacteria bacterium]